jgi:hypothetical protein
MKNVLHKNGNALRFGLLCAAVFTVLLTTLLLGRGPASPPPAAQTLPRPWTAVGSTGAVDEASLNTFAFGTTEIGFKAGATSTKIVARYNVTNTFDNNANPNRPGWTTMEMGSNAPINTIVTARLFQVKACDQSQVQLCMITNRSSDAPCGKCTINGTIDFTNSLYYVEVTLDRISTQSSPPSMYTLRIF